MSPAVATSAASLFMLPILLMLMLWLMPAMSGEPRELGRTVPEFERGSNPHSVMSEFV